ncbi:hypothetical protein EW145_g417 [Phellinidium pouzarii]|uniref:Major facilitator superfamily (MFS) profile domain-containing protein n=1 Tax=Phellinidium pouzarii TaxID=167371 RepID=A0A4S4LIL6_9AGAM|nr:hypothetical protein EW145_g417 [Phellinidium pouzarii]
MVESSEKPRDPSIIAVIMPPQMHLENSRRNLNDLGSGSITSPSDIKTDFNLSYMMSSLLFIASTIGFALGVILIERVMRLMGTLRLSHIKPQLSRFAFRSCKRRQQAHTVPAVDKKPEGKTNSTARARFRILVVASVLHASFFIIMGTARGFANVLAAYFVASFGKAFLNGTVNAYVAASPKRPLGQLYACNVLSGINTTLLALAFRPTWNEYAEEGNGSAACVETPPLQTSMITENAAEKSKTAMLRSDTVLSEKTVASSASWSPIFTAPRDRSTLRYALTLRFVWAFSFFMWIYSGSETSTQGYMATYLLAVRNANPNTVGYVTSGFWGGMAISRLTTGLVSP